MRLEIIDCTLNSLILLITQLIRDDLIRIIIRGNRAMILSEVNKITFCCVWLNLKPLCSFFAGNSQFLQISVEVFVRERTEWLRHIRGTKMPPCLVIHSDRMRLLIDTSFDIPLRKTNLGPTIVRRYSGSGVGITLRSNLYGCVYLNSCHYASPLKLITRFLIYSNSSSLIPNNWQS